MRLQLNQSDNFFTCVEPEDLTIKFLVERKDKTCYMSKMNLEDFREPRHRYIRDDSETLEILSQLDWKPRTPEIHPKLSYSYTIQECDI